MESAIPVEPIADAVQLSTDMQAPRTRVLPSIMDITVGHAARTIFTVSSHRCKRRIVPDGGNAILTNGNVPSATSCQHPSLSSFPSLSGLCLPPGCSTNRPFRLH